MLSIPGWREVQVKYIHVREVRKRGRMRLYSPTSSMSSMCQMCVWLISNFSTSEVTTLWYYTTHTRLTALCPGLPRWAGTRKVKPIWILLEQETVSLSGISWAICKSASRSRQITTPAPHLSFLQAGCLSCCPTNSVKALKAMFIIIIIIIIIVCNVCIECTYFWLFLDFGNKLSSLLTCLCTETVFHHVGWN